MCLICFIKEDFRRKDSNKLKTFRYAHNRKRKKAKHWILVRKMNTCNSRTACRRGPTSYLQQQLQQQQQQQQQQQLMLHQKHAAAESCRSNKQQQAPTSCAPRRPLESAPPQQDRPNFFVALFVRDQAEQNEDEKKTGKTRVPIFRPPCILHAVAPMSSLDANRLVILSSSHLHNHNASSVVSAPQERPRQGSTVMN